MLDLKATAIPTPISTKGEAESQQGGTAVTITAVTEGLETNTTKAPPPASNMPSAPEVRPPEGTVFLLVDDNPINLKILSSYMKKIGRPYATAINGLEAVEAFCQDPDGYKCVFMDISMPIMDGFEATLRIRSHELERNLKHIPVFALSGLASASAQQEALESGIDLFLTKPVKLKELSAVLEDRGLL